jgi:hypothetical protein
MTPLSVNPGICKVVEKKRLADVEIATGMQVSVKIQSDSKLARLWLLQEAR